MTYQDPKLPNVEPGRNPPVYRKPADDTSGAGTIVAMVVGAVLIVGAAVYAFSGPKRTASTTPPTTTGQSMPSTTPVAPRMVPVAPAAPSTATPPATTSAPTTTGQGSPRTMAPVMDQVKPTLTPAPAPTASPTEPSKQGVDVEESPTTRKP